MDWIDELREESRRRADRDTLEMQRAVILSEEGRIFFDKLAEEVKRGLAAFTLREHDVVFEHQAGKSFVARKVYPYPGITVEASLSQRHIMFRTKTRTHAATLPDETSWTIDYCLGTGDQMLYACLNGRQLDGLDAAAKLIVRKVFNL